MPRKIRGQRLYLLAAVGGAPIRSNEGIVKGDAMRRNAIPVVAFLSLLVLGWSSAARSDGDPVRGKMLYTGSYHCTDCHTATPTAAQIAAGSTADGLLNVINTEVEMAVRYLRNLAQNPTDLADIAAYIASFGAPPQPPPGAVTAVEYYYADWDYYFETAFPDEIAGLDAGAYGGVWKRTGQTFYVWPSDVLTASAVPALDAQPSAVNPLAVPTCRFFTTFFAPKSSHFYTPNAPECDGLKATSQVWQFESIAFYIALIDVNGLCPFGTVPLYRMYNDGMGGAPNHRYTTSLATLNQMIAAGWLFEGDLVTKVFACVPH